MFLLIKFFNASTSRNFRLIQLSGCSHQKVFVSKPFGNLGISISALVLPLELALASALQKIYHCLQKFCFKNTILCSFLGLVMASVPLCYKYLFLCDFLLFIHPNASIGALEKDYLNFRKNPSIGVLKK